MASIRALKAIDKLLRDLMKNNIPFGGKVFVMGGDFRQTPPVVHKGSRAKIVENSIKSYVSQNFEVFELTKNMRADPKQNKNVFVDEMNKEILEKKVLGKKVTKFRYEKSFTY